MLATPASGPAAPAFRSRIGRRTAAAPASELVALVAAEHSVEPEPEAQFMAAEIRRRHGQAVRGVLFYGSCLRNGCAGEGVLDFYVVVGDYRTAYRRGTQAGLLARTKSWLLALANWLLPPSVYYVEVPWQGRTLRMKYNIIAQRDFSRACRHSSWHAIIWGRFCQPSQLVWARDRVVRERLAEDGAEAVLTMVRNMLALAPPTATVEGLWQFGFARTYATELRPETADTIGKIFRAAPERYRVVTELAVKELVRRSVIDATTAGEEAARSDAERPVVAGQEPLQSQGDQAPWPVPVRQRAIVRRWRWSSTLAKPVYLVRLVKSALTFGDWLPYVLWKLGRHTGVQIELTERQRRHPLVWGWPVLLRLMMQQIVR